MSRSSPLRASYVPPSACVRTPIAIAVGLALVSSLPAAYAQAPLPGAALGAEFQVNSYTSGDQSDAAVAIDAAGDFVVVWVDSSGISAQRYQADGTPEGSEFQINTSTGGVISPSVAMDAGGDFVVAWTDLNTSVSPITVETLARRYHADGTPDGTELQVSAPATNFQGFPAVAMDAAGDFVIAWQNYGAGGDIDIFVQRYRADGTPAGSEFQVNTYTSGTQEAPAVAMDAAGSFVVAWEDDGGEDGDGGGIFMRRYKADGTPAGSELQVNTYTSGNQQGPAVAMDAAGDFAVAWEDYGGEDGGGHGIFMQRYKADGTRGGSEFRVNTHTSGDQRAPVVAMDAGGEFIVAWSDYSGIDGDGAGVFAQRYKADGEPEGSEFHANSHTSEDQHSPAVAMDAAGDVVAAWWGQYGTEKYGDIFARRYARESSLDLESTLAVAPANGVKPGGGLTFTAGISNTETPATLTGNATIDAALTSANGLTANLTLPGNVSFTNATGTNWTCPAAPTGNKLSCTYNARLAAARETESLTVSVTAPATVGTKLSFSNVVFGDQPDVAADNNSASASLITDNAPEAVNGSLSATENTTATGQLHADDADGDQLSYSLVAAPASGKIIFDQTTGAYAFTPKAGFSGTDSFTFKASDGTLDSNTARIAITVKAASGDTGGGGAFAWLGLSLIGLAFGFRSKQEIS
ncbi:MAG TPA: Ig-like domain-containing protein [Gammaproteobacteria bacterium]|nr:Ig-like domain-containing protein [Gammaproteobacteria bacterium]